MDVKRVSLTFTTLPIVGWLLMTPDSMLTKNVSSTQMSVTTEGKISSVVISGFIGYIVVSLKQEIMFSVVKADANACPESSVIS